MPGLVPGIHVFTSLKQERRGWPGASASGSDAVLRAAMPGHDENEPYSIGYAAGMRYAGSSTICKPCRAAAWNQMRAIGIGLAKMESQRARRLET